MPRADTCLFVSPRHGIRFEWKPGKCMGKAQDLSTASKGLPIWDLAFEEGPETDALKTHAGG